MEDADDSSLINFDVVPHGANHWYVVVDGTRSLVPFASRDSAAAAARAQARQFHLHRGLPTRVRIADQRGGFKCTNCYNQDDDTPSKMTEAPSDVRRVVSHIEMLVRDTRLENDVADRHMDLVALSRADMETSYGAHRPAALEAPSVWERLFTTLRILPRCRPRRPASCITVPKGAAS